MRILSQDNGKYDLQYENITLEKMTDSNTIYAYTGTGQPFKMASYSSTAKMDKAMEILHSTYTGMIFTQNVKMPEGGADELKEMVKNGFGIVSIMKDRECTKFEPLNVCFKFPSDSEIEV